MRGTPNSRRLLKDLAYSQLAANNSTAEPANRIGQILNQTTRVRAPVSPVSKGQFAFAEQSYSLEMIMD